MTLLSNISTIRAALSNIKNAIIAKGQTPSGNITTYATAISNIGGIKIPREVKNNVYQTPTTNFTFSLPNNAININTYALAYAFQGCTGLTSVDLSTLTTVSGQRAFNSAFNSCTGLTSVDLSALTTVSGQYAFHQAFNSCTGLTSVDLSALTTVSGQNAFYQTFYGCTGLISISFPALTTVNGYALYQAFRGCTGLTSISFPALTTTSFGSNVNQFYEMMSGTGSTTTHTIHFPSNLESKISTLITYPLFGGTSGYVTLAYDLPATS